MASFRPRTLGDFGAILWRRKWLLLLVTAAMLKASLTVIEMLPYVYESRARLAVLTKPSDDMQTLAAQISALTLRAKSRENLEPLIRQFQLGKPNEQMDAVIERVSAGIKIEVKLREYYPQFPETIAISFRHIKPEVTQKIVTEMVDKFTETNETLRLQAEKDLSEVKQEIALLGEPLGKISRQRALAARPPSAGQTPQQEDPRVLRRTLLTEINVLSNKQYALQRQLALQQQQVAEQQTLARTAPASGGATANSSYGVLLAEKARLEAQERDFATQYTPENPKLKQARLQLEQINRQIEKLERSAPVNTMLAATPEGRELRGMEREGEKLKTELEVTQREIEAKRQELAQLPAALPTQPAAAEPVASDASTDVEYERLSKRYYWLLERQEALSKAQTSLLVGPNLSLFRVIDGAYLPKTPVAPSRGTLKVVALGLALGMGLLVIAALEAREFFRIHNEQDVEYYLGAPVVGLIPETLTPVESGLARRQKLAQVGLVMLLAALAVPVFIVLLSRIGIFEVIGYK
jgi:uncharacterized protein involved in exopolysaccharide biosynthesis